MNSVRLTFERITGDRNDAIRDWITFLNDLYVEFIQDAELLAILNRVRYEYKIPSLTEMLIILRVLKAKYVLLGISSTISSRLDNNYFLGNAVEALNQVLTDIRTGVVTSGPVAKEIQSLAVVGALTPAYQTTFGSNGVGVGLPPQVMATFTDASNALVDMTWAVGGYLPNTDPGFFADTPYTIIGTPVTTPTVLNTALVTRSVSVTVKSAFAPFTSGIQGVYATKGLVDNTSNVYGTVASGSINVLKSLAPGPLGRDLIPNGIAPTLSGGKAVMIGTGSFQSPNKTDFKFLSYNVVPNNLKWTIIFGGNITDNATTNAILGDHGFSASNDGMSLNFGLTAGARQASIFITGTGGVVNDATFAAVLTTGIEQLHVAQFDYSLGTGSRSKWFKGVTPFTTVSAGAAVPRNNTSDDEMNFGDAGTFQAFDQVGTQSLWVILDNTETDAVRNKFMSDCSVLTGITL